MITHVVTFTWKPDMTDEQKRTVHEGLLALPDQIPSLRTYSVGPDIGATDGNADFAVVGTFDDVDGWKAYVDHPAHLAVVVEHIRPFLTHRSVVQFES